MFEYVYVLVSKPGDTYYEQTLISAISLRNQMPNACITLLVDEKTKETLVENRSEIKKYVSKIVSACLPKDLSNMQKSRWLKTSMPEYIKNDFLYIDSDTVITSSLEDIEQNGVALGAVLDRHSLFSTNCCRYRIQKNAEKLGFCPAVCDRHFNGGVLLVRQNEKNVEFFKLWHKLWLESLKKNISIDQISLAQANYMCNGIIQELPGIWNCQVENGFHYLFDAKVLHMFVLKGHHNRRPHPLMDSNFYLEIEKNGISDTTLNIIRNPLSFFSSKLQIIGDNSVDYWHTSSCQFFGNLYSVAKAKRIFFVIDSLLEHLTKILKKFITH